MSNKTRDRKHAALKSRTALSVRNITEHTQSECSKAVKRNRNLKSTALRTSREYIGKVIAANPSKEQDSK